MAKKKKTLQDILDAEKKLKEEKERFIQQIYVDLGKLYFAIKSIDNENLSLDDVLEMAKKELKQLEQSNKIKSNSDNNHNHQNI